MAKNITRIVLTGGPAGGKTTLVSRVLREFRRENGWKVITIPESATDLISGFGIKPFDNCVSMLEFQYFVIGDQLHKERLALRGAEKVPEENILILYDRAVFDDLAYINYDEFREVLAYYGTTPEAVLAGYDAVIHLVTCAKGAEFAYNFGNAARYESVEDARVKDDLTLKAWSAHPNVHVIDNSVNFEAKINRALNEIYSIIGQAAPQSSKRKFLIKKPDVKALEADCGAVGVRHCQTYLTMTSPSLERRISLQDNGREHLRFYTEKRTDADGNKWITERPLSEKEYSSYYLERDTGMENVNKTKYTFFSGGHKMDVDIYPFSDDKAIFFIFGDGEVEIPADIEIIKEVTGVQEYKNRNLARIQRL